MPSFPEYRPRRLRSSERLRSLVRETALSPGDLVAPLFVSHADDRQPVESMPGVFRLSVDAAAEAAASLDEAGVGAVLLFGIPEAKDERAGGAYAADGVVQRAVGGIKDRSPDLVVITDLCLCEYMEHGHCGVLTETGEVDNDATLDLLARTAVSQAEAGADIVAPSDMMDGRVGAVRQALDESGLSGTAIMSYAAKYASAFYGPFRDAADSAPSTGDRRGYQMDPANGDEAIREVLLDIEEGADIVLVKPALPCLDIVYRVKETTGWPLAAYHVSGEYSMLKAAAERGWLDEEAVALEATLAIRRAGADLVITYYAERLARLLGG